MSTPTTASRRRSRQIQRIYERRPTAKVFPGDISRGRSHVHLDDAVEAFRDCVARQPALPPETIVLIGEPDPLGYDELQRALARLIHGETDWETVSIPKAVAKAGGWAPELIPGVEEPVVVADDHYALDITRARTLLGWWPRRTLRGTLPRMVAALEADPGEFYRRNGLEGAPPTRHASTAPARRNSTAQAA